jgi:vitamin B12 transporter
MLTRSVPLVVIALVAAPGALLAQQDSAVTLPDIVVSESRVPIPATAVTSAVTVLSGDDLRARGVTLVEDALRAVPGLTVSQGGSDGAVSSVFLRGGESDYVKVLVDGVAVNEPGGAFDFATLTLDDVERIEIVRGPASVTYGSDAMTGVVRIITRSSRGPTHGSLEATGGNRGSFAARGNAAGRTGTLGWSAGASGSGTDGVYDFNSRFRNAAAVGRLSWTPDTRSDVQAVARYGWNTFHFPTDGVGVPSDSNQFSKGRSLALGLDGGRQLSTRVELRGAAGLSHTGLDFDDQPDGAWDTTGFGFASERAATSTRWNVDGRTIIRPDPSSFVSVGAQFEREVVHTTASYTSNFGGGASTDPDPPFDRTRNDAAVYAEARTEPVVGLIVTAGGRVDDDQAFGGHATWRVGARLSLPKGFALRSAAGTGFKAPTLAENFAQSPFEVGNPDLEPERSRSWEVALEYEPPTGIVQASIGWYDQRFRNLIQYVSAAPGEPTYENLGAALARGIETSVTVRPVRYVSGGATWSWLDSRVTDAGASTSPGFAEGEALIRRPAHTLRFWAEAIPVTGVQAHAEVRYTGARDDVDFGSFPSARVTLPGVGVVDASVTAELVAAAGSRPGVSLIGRVENLFDAAYDLFAGFPGRPRTVIGGVRVGW